MKLNTKLFITAGVVITTAMMNAQSTATKLPGDATLPSSKANLEQLFPMIKETSNTKSKIILQDQKLHNLKFLLMDSSYLTKKKIITRKIMFM
jgi:hypothetical protein